MRNLSSWMIAILLSFSFVAATATHEWTFDDTYDLTDSIGSITGTANGTEQVPWTQCFKNECYYFDGVNDYANLSADPIGISTSFSMRCMVRPNITNAAQYFYTSTGSTELGFALGLNSSGYWEFKPVGQVGSNAGVVPTQGSWYHILWTYNSTSADFYTAYINGVRTADTASLNITQGTTNNWRFGTYHPTVGWYQGWLDECKTWNTTLTDAEASADFSALMSGANATVRLTLYDEQTDTIITDGTGTINLINYANLSSSYTTDSGSVGLYNLSLGNYKIAYAATGYAQRFYDLSLNTSSSYNITLYLLNSSDTGNAYKKVTVYDESGSALGNATVFMQRFFLGCNCYRDVESSTTSDEGFTFFFAELYDGLYKFIVRYNNDIKKTTGETKLDTRDLTITSPILTSHLEGYYDVVTDTTTYLNFSTASNVWTYTWSGDATNTVSGKLKVVRKAYDSETILSEQSTSAVSGTLTYNQTAYLNQTGTFTAFGYIVNPDGKTYLVQEMTYTYNDSKNIFGMQGVFLAMLVLVVFALIGVYNPAAGIGLMLFGLMVVSFSGLLYIQATYIIGMVVLGMVFMFSMRN